MSNTTNPKERLRMAKDNGHRPVICVGDVVKAKRRSARGRDDRLFVVLKICRSRDSYFFREPEASYNGEDILRIKEYKKKGAKAISVMRKGVWFTGKKLSL